MPALKRALITAMVVLVTITTVLAVTDEGWTIPPTANQEANPVPLSPQVLEKGRKIFETKCQRCHGKDGRGLGPDVQPEHPAGNLTDRLRGAFNADGVMFYKIWNGRTAPKMPAFKNEEMSKEDVWTVVHYAKTFRK